MLLMAVKQSVGTKGTRGGARKQWTSPRRGRRGVGTESVRGEKKRRRRRGSLNGRGGKRKRMVAWVDVMSVFVRTGADAMVCAIYVELV